MLSMVPATPAEAVANGAQLLDEKLPGWWRAIDLGALRLAKCDLCVCGQLATSMLGVAESFRADLKYTYTLNSLGLEYCESDGLYGFNVSMEIQQDEDATAETIDAYYHSLEVEWRKVITARLEADQLALTPTEKKERVPV